MSYGVWMFWLARFDVTCWNPIDFLFLPFLLAETSSRLSCNSRLILKSATMMTEVWYFQVCILCHPCLIIGYLLLYLGLSGSMYQDFSVVVIIFASFGKSMTLFCRFCLGIFSPVIRKPRDTRKYLQAFVIAIVRIAFTNGATNCNMNFPFYRLFFMCIIIGLFVYFFAHVCHVVGSDDYAGTVWVINVTISQWFYILFRFKFNFAESDLESKMECNSACCWERT